MSRGPRGIEQSVLFCFSFSFVFLGCSLGRRRRGAPHYDGASSSGDGKGYTCKSPPLPLGAAVMPLPYIALRAACSGILNTR